MTEHGRKDRQDRNVCYPTGQQSDEDITLETETEAKSISFFFFASHTNAGITQTSAEPLVRPRFLFTQREVVIELTRGGRR